MKIAFLICALALPSGTWSADKRYKMLEEMIHEWYPAHDIILVNNDERMVGERYLMTPLIYRQLRVWLVRSA